MPKLRQRNTTTHHKRKKLLQLRTLGRKQMIRRKPTKWENINKHWQIEKAIQEYQPPQPPKKPNKYTPKRTLLKKQDEIKKIEQELKTAQNNEQPYKSWPDTWHENQRLRNTFKNNYVEMRKFAASYGYLTKHTEMMIKHKQNKDKN